MEKLLTIRNATITLGLITICLISASIGAKIGQGMSVTVHSQTDIQYVDFVSIILTAIGVLLAALGVMIGLMAIIGWATFRSSVDKAVTVFLDERMQKGGATFSQIVSEVEEASTKSVIDRVFKELGRQPIEDELREDT